jgi:hypothetical protein
VDEREGQGRGGIKRRTERMGAGQRVGKRKNMCGREGGRREEDSRSLLVHVSISLTQVCRGTGSKVEEWTKGRDKGEGGIKRRTERMGAGQRVSKRKNI